MNRRRGWLSGVGLTIGMVVGGGAMAVAASLPALPDEADDTAHDRLTVVDDDTVATDEPDGDVQVLQESDESDESDQLQLDESDGEAGESAEAFSAWASSLPGDWGCVRGFLISRSAQGDHRGDDFTPPTGADADLQDAVEAAGELGLDAERRCVQVALGGDEVEVEAEAGPPEHAGPPEDAVPPEHAGAPEHAGPPDHAGPPEHAGQGAPTNGD